MNIIILPVVFEDQVKAVIELASFQRFNSTHQGFFEPAHRKHRHRVEHDRSKLAYRRLAQAIAIADERTTESSAGTAEDESRTRGKGHATRRAERGGRT